MDEQNIDNQNIESQQIPGLDPFAPQPEQRIATDDYDIQSISYLNKDKTLYKVELPNGVIHYLPVDGETDLGCFIKYRLEDSLIEVGKFKNKGVFYKKDDATLVNEVDDIDGELYTTVEPLKSYSDGTTQAFNNTTEAWEYVNKGEELISEEYANELKQLKSDRLIELTERFKDSKLIVIDGNYTIEIYHNTEQRDQFLQLIELVGKGESSNGAVLSYHQTETDKIYDIALVPYIWKYIYTKLFLTQRDSGFKESLRYANKRKYDECFLKIKNATTLEAVNAIDFQFISPNGIVIDIDQNAHAMLNDVEVPQEIKDLITPFLDENGNVTNIINVKYL